MHTGKQQVYYLNILTKYNLEKKLANLKIKEEGTFSTVNELTRVSGIGPAKAKALVDDGILTIEDLKNHTDKLNHHQIIGLKYLEDFEKRIPREEIEKIENAINKTISDLDSEYLTTICGSYRRGLPDSGDVDVLLTHPSYTSNDTGKNGKKKASTILNTVIKLLQDTHLITETISLGDVKFMGACKIEEVTRRLDIRLVPFDQYYCAILYFTGSDIFNKEMRAHALQQGFTLNEYAIRPLGSTGMPGEELPVTSERDIFEIIDYPYKKPTERSL
uniref:DNA polymerase n=1 Tax=Clastoptera arizonana TaxID=38151 RepID=A0A1B6ECW4_9HEMI